MKETCLARRKQYGDNDTIRDQGLTTPSSIERYNSIQYGPNPTWNRLDVYRPRQAKGKKLPVIVSVHGGGWVYGDKERYQYYCMELAKRGFAVVNFTYRLVPEFHFPCFLEDTNSVMHWVLDHEDDYLFDSHALFCVGDSAGAHILSLYAAIWSNPSYAVQYALQLPPRLHIRAMCLNCGVYDVEDHNKDDIMDVFFVDGVTEKNLHLISASHYVTSSFPPCFLMTCEKDFLRDQTMMMVQQLWQQQVPCDCKFYVSREQALAHVFFLDLHNPASKSCIDDQTHYLKTCITD